jgi:hypothetical protein
LPSREGGGNEFDPLPKTANVKYSVINRLPSVQVTDFLFQIFGFCASQDFAKEGKNSGPVSGISENKVTKAVYWYAIEKNGD